MGQWPLKRRPIKPAAIVLARTNAAVNYAQYWMQSKMPVQFRLQWP